MYGSRKCIEVHQCWLTSDIIAVAAVGTATAAAVGHATAVAAVVADLKTQLPKLFMSQVVARRI